MNPQLENPLLMLVRSQSSATGKLVILKQEDGPVLNRVDGHQFDFSTQPSLHLIGRKGAADQGRHLGVTPKCRRERQVVFAPAAESETIRVQEIRTKLAHFRFPIGAEISFLSRQRQQFYSRFVGSQ